MVDSDHQYWPVNRDVEVGNEDGTHKGSFQDESNINKVKEKNAT